MTIAKDRYHWEWHAFVSRTKVTRLIQAAHYGSGPVPRPLRWGHGFALRLPRGRVWIVTWRSNTR